MTYNENPEFILDDFGNKIKVVLGYKDYIGMLELIEDTEDSKLIAQTLAEPTISLEEYKRKRNLV